MVIQEQVLTNVDTYEPYSI